MRFNLSIISKISIIVFCSIIAVLVPLLYLVMHNSSDLVSTIEIENLNRFNNLLKWENIDDLEFAGMILQQIVEDETVHELFNARNREGLYEYLVDNYEYLKDRIIRFHFHLPDGTSFLRVHNVDLYGDDLLQIRPMLVEMIKSKTTLEGMELGKEGLSQRVMMPIFHGDEYIGSVEYGMEFGFGYLMRMKERYQGEYFIYSLDSNGIYSLLSSTGAKSDCNITEQDINQLLRQEHIWSKDCDGQKNVGMIPLVGFSGSTIAFLKLEFSRDEIVEGLSVMKSQFVLTSAIIAIVITVVVFISLLYVFFKPLRNLVRQTTKISRQIDAGNINFRGDISETAVDFREIINAVNNIISTLRDRENILKAILEGFPGIVYYLNRDFTVLWANERVKSIAGGEIIGINILNKVSKSSFFAMESELLNEAISSKKTCSRSECYFYSKDQTLLKGCWEHVAIPICNDHGFVVSIVRIATDITEKEEAQEKLKKLNETLEHRVAEEIRKRKLQEDKIFNQSRLASIGEMAAGIAHELNQPLNSIAFSVENIYTRFSNNTMEDDYFKTKIKAISGDIHRTRNLISHVRTFARDSGEEYNIRFSINQCIANALSMVGTQLATHEIDVMQHLDDGIPEVRGNPYQFEQVVLNLLSNARDAIDARVQQETSAHVQNPQPRKIHVSTSVHAKSVEFSVTDNGTGIPEELINKVFDPFFSTKNPGAGTGLGLSISYGIVKKMNGSIEIVPEIQGTTMRITIPIGA